MGERGTKRTPVSKKTDWTGEKFKKSEEKRLEKSGVKYITSGRGTGKLRFDETKSKKKPKYRGKLTTGRGTGSKKA